MISLKSGLPIKPLILHEPEDIMKNSRLKLEIQSIIPELAVDKHYVSFHLQARAAIWLDVVLDLVRSPKITTPAGRVRFRTVDKELLQFLTILFELGVGACCEAIAIALK